MRILLIFIGSIISTVTMAFVPPKTSFGFGPELIYNLPLSEFSIGARAHYHLNDYIFLSPQISYTPPIKNIHELNLNTHIGYIFKPFKNYSPYATAGLYGNLWFNYQQSPMEKAKLLNFGGEIAGGILKTYGCVRPFAEYRINLKWFESYARVGINIYKNQCHPKRVCSTYIQ
jgi:hypothetical protein